MFLPNLTANHPIVDETDGGARGRVKVSPKSVGAAFLAANVSKNEKDWLTGKISSRKKVFTRS